MNWRSSKNTSLSANCPWGVSSHFENTAIISLFPPSLRKMAIFTGIESMVENPESESAHSQAEDEVVAGAIAAVDQAKAQDTSLGNLSSEVDGEYHEGKTLSSNASRYGLKPIKSAPADLKSTIPNIDQMLASHLMNVWGRSSPDQVSKRVEGWSQQGNTMTYRTAWDSDRYQCTWYVVSWDKNSNQVLHEGYQPCFGH
ncbi:hypothetical protein [Acinetobacter pittii]|uniref:hypothetical protein n=1 Tax=Acinetobacter pittii TaxID=48296 RepID=UPI002A015E13|nr:hypothetical protein [Acinetobacter pittii]MDX8161021.1 hypothetical protein [Acinetobacter pittii]MDX8265594.1 hypothetical protein [Acinetobacter pittii]